TRQPSTRASSSARLVAGTVSPASSELRVWRLTPTRSASSRCCRPARSRRSRKPVTTRGAPTAGTSPMRAPRWQPGVPHAKASWLLGDQDLAGLDDGHDRITLLEAEALRGAPRNRGDDLLPSDVDHHLGHHAVRGDVLHGSSQLVARADLHGEPPSDG